MPLPPFSGPAMTAAGPSGRSLVVVTDSPFLPDPAALLPPPLPPLPLLLLSSSDEHAAATTSATAMPTTISFRAFGAFGAFTRSPPAGRCTPTTVNCILLAQYSRSHPLRPRP